LVVAMICQLVIAPCSKLSMTRRFAQTTLADELSLGAVDLPRFGGQGFSRRLGLPPVSCS
jgi:hypothetical protein